MRKKGFRNKIRRTAAFVGFTTALTALAPSSAFAAQSARMARTEEEWAALEDNNLEYDEIADLIHEYNPTVISNNYDYDEFIDEYGETNKEVAKAYRDLANELADNMYNDTSTASGLISDVSTELEVKSLRSAADNNTDDKVTKSLGYALEEAELVLTAQTNFIAYYQNQVSLKEAELTLKSLENSLALVQVQVAAGTATNSDLLDATKAVSDQETSVTMAEEAIEESRQNLIIMFGWETGHYPVIGELPEVTEEELDAIDLETDLQTAEDNNYTLALNRRKLSNALDEDNVATLNNTIASNKSNISASVTSAYQSLNNARLSLSVAESSLATEQKNMAIAEAEHAAGTSTQFEYTASALALEEKELAVETARLNLLSAYATYSSYVGGTASAG